MRASLWVSGEEWGEGMTAHATRSEPERIDCHACGERRVDPAGEPEQHTLEAVLVDVVAQPQAERLVDLLVGLERLGPRAPDGGRLVARRSVEVARGP